MNNPDHGHAIRCKGFDYFVEVAKLLEKLHFKTLFYPDHFVLPKNKTMYDCWTAITGLAAETESIRLGSLVTPIPLYTPHVLAKRVATADIISKGRVIFGAGSGWYRRDFESYGTPYWSFRVRNERMLEGIRVIKALFTEEGPINVKGKHHVLREAFFSPKPLQKPHPPIWFGGSSLTTLMAVAREGQGWIPYETPSDAMEDRIKKLKGILTKSEREIDEVTIALATRLVMAEGEKEVEARLQRLSLKRNFQNSLGKPSSMLCGTPEQVTEQIRSYANLGVNHLVVCIQPYDEIPEGLELLTKEVKPEIEKSLPNQSS